MRVMVVDDDRHVVEILSRYLSDEGYAVDTAPDAATALRAVERVRPDVIVLDVRLPDAYGLDTLRELKERVGAPVILLTALTGELETVLGLELGADDYITKPFSPREVLARIRTVYRRFNAAASSDAASPHIVAGDIEVDPRSYELIVGGKRIALTVTEFRVLELLARSPGQVFTRAQLLDAIRADYDILDRTLDKHINNLRKKIEANPAEPARIVTVRGVGYKLVKQEARTPAPLPA